MSRRYTHWTHAGLTFVLTVLGAGILLPLIRVQPEFVHKYFNGLSDVLRIAFAFFLSLVFTAATFKLLSPRLRHLAHWKTHPPAWLVALAAWIVIAVWDVTVGFVTGGYRATAWEWLGYGGGSLLIVGWHFGLWSDLAQMLLRREKSRVETTASPTLEEIETAAWLDVEAWLTCDTPASYDLLGNRSVADRVSNLLASGTRSVGVVGAFGAGKTSLVTWISDRLTRNTDARRRFFVCHHSCWGFETSASAIHDMLGSAISKLSEVIDTFQVDSLPESYRKTFSAGGEWIETVSNLILRSPDPMEQFERLSGLLQSIGGTLVFVVEDLDRNETRSFEIQEVLAFLERLKPFPNLSFVLTGGLSSSQRIDYSKLCDHIEYLRTVQQRHSSTLAVRLYRRCHDQTVFPHEPLGGTDQQHHWSPLSGLMMRDYEELSFPQAVASLLNTPRSLRHALGRTLSAWRTLYGEIDFNHLLAVNVLRFGAPECFQFLLRRWDRLHSPPNQGPDFVQGRSVQIRQAIMADWNRTIHNVEWNPAAALQVLEFLLPPTEYWLQDEAPSGHSSNTPQGVWQERYWVRAINESLNEGDIRDQEVIRDIRGWLDAPGSDSELVTRLTTSSAYSDVWEDLAFRYFDNDRGRILLLCGHVLDRIQGEQGVESSSDSQGFIAIWRYANRHAGKEAANAQWLQDRITEAAGISLGLVNSMWHYWGSGNDSILQPNDREAVRQHMVGVLQQQLTTAEALAKVTHPEFRYVFFQLVFDPGGHTPVLAGPEVWGWLGQVLLAGLHAGQVTTAIGVCSLVAVRDGSSRREPSIADPNLLRAFFGDNSVQAIDAIERLLPQVDENDRSFVRDIVQSARSALNSDGNAVESE